MATGGGAQGNGQDILAGFQAALAQYMQQGSAPSGSPSSSDPLLFVGNQPGAISTIENTGATRKLPFDIQGQTENTQRERQIHGGQMSLSQAQQLWYTWTQAQRLSWTKHAYALGYLSSPTDVGNAGQLWLDMVQKAAAFYQAGKKTVSPWDVLDMYAGSNADTLKKRAAVNKDGSITQTNSSIDLSDKLGVEAIATRVLQQALGRDPSQAELNTYYNTIRAQEQAHPTVTRTTTSANGMSTTNVVSSGFTEADADQFLMDRIKQDPEYAKYQAGTTYFDAAMQANAAIGGA